MQLMPYGPIAVFGGYILECIRRELLVLFQPYGSHSIAFPCQGEAGGIPSLQLVQGYWPARMPRLDPVVALQFGGVREFYGMRRHGEKCRRDPVEGQSNQSKRGG